MKKLFIFIFLSFLAITAFAQVDSSKAVSFCNQTGTGRALSIELKVEDLKNCPLRLVPVDTNLSVTRFKLTIFKKNNSEQVFNVIGDTIPINLKEALYAAKMFLVEYVYAASTARKDWLLEPISVKLLQ